MPAHEPQPAGHSLFEVLRRQSTTVVATFAIIAIASLAFVLIHKFSYAAISHVVLVNDPAGRDPTVTGVDMPTIATGSSVLITVKKQLGLTESVYDLRKSVIARIPPRSSLMTIAVQNHDPELAIRINNAVADTFAKFYWRLASSRYNDVIQRLDVDVAAARRRVAGLERRLESASAGVAYVGSQSSLDASAAHLGELEENRGVTLGQVITDRANLRADFDQPAKAANAVRSEILKGNAAYNETDALVARDVSIFTTTRAGVKAIFPGIAGFNDKVTKEVRALALLRDSALASPDAYSPSQLGLVIQTAKDGAAVRGDEAKLAAFDEQITTLKQKLSSPQIGVPSMGALRAERDTAEAQERALSLSLSNAQAASAQASSLGDVVVVDRATEARETLVGPVLVFALGLAAALLFAAGAAYLAEILLPRFLGSADVESVYGRPILATLRAR